MNFPCPINQPCLDPQSPFANLSSERPDILVFIGYNFGWWNGGNFLLGDHGGGGDGVGTCDSPISQADADQCAANCQLSGDCGGPGSGPPTTPPTDPTGNPIRYYHNQTVGCTVLCPDGTPFNSAYLANQITARTQAQANAIAFNNACQQAERNKVCMGDLQSACCLNAPYNSTITSTLPITDIAIISGMVPPGLFFAETFNTRPLLTGTPTAAGNYTFTVLFTAANFRTATKTFTISVLGITDADPAPATKNTVYTFQFTAAGGTAPYTFALESGPLPAGISLDSTGLLSGTPTEDGDFNITVSVTDSAP